MLICMRNLCALFFLLLALASAQSAAAPKKKGPTMQARGTFEVTLEKQSDANLTGTLARMTISKQFHGDLEGTSSGQMLSAGSPAKGSAGYVAMELVSGTLGGHKGTFVLQHSATMAHGAQEMSITVVPDSASEELTGLSGRMKIIIEGGRHAYEFEYSLSPR